MEFVDEDSCVMGTPSVMWAWVSDNQIINLGTEQCLALDSESALVTSQCAADDQQTFISYDKETNLLMVAGRYIDSSSGEITAQGTGSNDWTVEVGEDAMETDLSQMKGIRSIKWEGGGNYSGFKSIK